MNFMRLNEKRENSEIETYKKKIFDANKWDIIKLRKNKMQSNLEYLRECSQRQKQFKYYFTVLSMLKLLLKIFFNLKKKRA